MGYDVGPFLSVFLLSTQVRATQVQAVGNLSYSSLLYIARSCEFNILTARTHISECGCGGDKLRVCAAGAHGGTQTKPHVTPTQPKPETPTPAKPETPKPRLPRNAIRRSVCLHRRRRRKHPSPPPPLSPPPSPRTHLALKAPRLRLNRPFTCVPRHLWRAPARAPASSAPFLIAAPGWSKVCRFGDFGQAPERHCSLPSAPQAARALPSGQEGSSVDSIMGACKLGQFLMLRR